MTQTPTQVNQFQFVEEPPVDKMVENKKTCLIVLLFFSSRGKIEKRETRSLFFEKSRLVFLENFSFYTKVKVQFWNFLLILIGNFLVLSGDSL